jgi:hypothetical protein
MPYYFGGGKTVTSIAAFDSKKPNADALPAREFGENVMPRF